LIKCSGCGNKNKDGEAFCAFCAAILPINKPSSENKNVLPKSPISSQSQKSETPLPIPQNSNGTSIPVPQNTAESQGQNKEKNKSDKNARNSDVNSKTNPGVSLDPLDQFLKEKKNPENLHVKNIGNFIADFDHLEDQLDDAHRAEVMKAKMAALHSNKNTQTTTAEMQGKDKLDQLDAILDSEFEKATKEAEKEKESAIAQESDNAKKEERIKKLEKYQKYLKTPEKAPTNTEGGNELIRYLESKVNQQSIEIENLKRQKEELIKEVFSDALNDETDDTKEKYKRAKKEIERLEEKVKSINNKKASLEEKLMTKSSQVEQLITDKNSGSNKVEESNKEIAKAYEAKIKNLQGKLQVTQRNLTEKTELLNSTHSKTAENDKSLKATNDQIARQTEIIKSLKTELSTAETKLSNTQKELDNTNSELTHSIKQSEEIAATNEGERYKKQIKALQERVKKTMMTSSTQLKSLSKYYEMMLNQIDETIIVFDNSRNILFINKSARNLLEFKSEETVNCNLSAIKPLAPLVRPAKDAATANTPLSGEGIIVKFPVKKDSKFEPHFYPISFPGKEAMLLVLKEIVAAGKSTETKEVSIEQLCSMKEQLFSLKILAEIIYSKRERADIVEETSEELKKELTGMLDSL